MRLFRLFCAAAMALEALVLVDGALPAMRTRGMGVAALVAVAVALCLAGAWQLWRGQGRGCAWPVAVGALLTGPWWWKPVTALPLAYLLTEALWPAGREERRGGAQESSRAWLLDFAVFGVAVLAHRLLWTTLLPGWMRPVTPADVGGGFAPFLAAAWVSILIHEAGHAAAGWAAGFRLVSLAVFPVAVSRTARTSWKPGLHITASGFYLGFPTRLDRLALRHAAMTAGGPAAGLLCAAGCWYALWAAAGRIDGQAFAVLQCAASISFLMSVSNLMPVRPGGLTLDGRHLWDALRGNDGARARLALSGCASSAVSAVRPRDWRPEWVEYLRREGGGDLLTLGLLAAQAEERLAGSPGDGQALDDLGRCAAMMTTGVERAWIRCRYGGITEGVRDVLVEAEGFELLRLQGALLAAEGDFRGAGIFLERAAGELGAVACNGLDEAELAGILAFRSQLDADERR